MNRFAPVLDVANAVLYEGYLLFPYTASSGKNRIRWQFGVIVPRDYVANGTGEACEFQTEFFFEHAPADSEPGIDVLVRFLQVESRRLEAYVDGKYEFAQTFVHDGTKHISFDEGAERELRARFIVGDGTRFSTPIAFPDAREIEDLRDPDGTIRGRIIRERWPLHGVLLIHSDALEGHPGTYRVAVRIQNESIVVPAEISSSALRTAFVSTHVLLGADGGTFVSTQDAPPELAEASARLTQRHLWPVLAGERGPDERRAALLFATPIILYDYPETAPQTEDHFDATEVDELLALSVRSLSDAERDEARRTDPRARKIIERAENLDATSIGRIHAGALHRVEAPPEHERAKAADPFADLDVPSFDCVFIDGVKVSKGSSVRLHPKRRADIWDMVIVGKTATVRAIHQDVENQLYVAVTIDDDPASDMHEWYGRAFFFYPEEIEPLAATESAR